MSTNTGERIHGPYPHRNRWKIVIHDRATGRRATRTFETEEQARAFARALQHHAQTRTVAQAVNAYLESAATRMRPASLATTEFRLGGLLAPVMESPLAGLGARRAEQLYTGYRQGRSVATHHNALGQARTWGRWCIKQGWLRANPWKLVEAQGTPSAGKAQLRIDEAGALLDWAFTSKDDRACAVLIAVLLGLRASEIVRLVPRDVDAGATVLWVPGTKSVAARRHLPIPELLRRPLQSRCDRPRLLPYRREWVRDAAHWACDQAGVERCCAHALRGLHVTLRVELAGISRDVGHGGTGVTERHYVAPGALERATAARVWELFVSRSFLGGRTLREPNS